MKMLPSHLESKSEVKRRNHKQLHINPGYRRSWPMAPISPLRLKVSSFPLYCLSLINSKMSLNNCVYPWFKFWQKSEILKDGHCTTVQEKLQALISWACSIKNGNVGLLNMAVSSMPVTPVQEMFQTLIYVELWKFWSVHFLSTRWSKIHKSKLRQELVKVTQHF